MTSGGWSDSEVTALAVVPTGLPSASIEVTTVTPVAKCPIALRNCAADTPVPDSAVSRKAPASVGMENLQSAGPRPPLQALIAIIQKSSITTS